MVCVGFYFLLRLTEKNKERMEREKVITLLMLVKENGLKIDIAADQICSLFNVGVNEVALKAFLQKFVNDCEMGDAHEPLHLEEAKSLL